jgi:hypothetical protein
MGLARPRTSRPRDHAHVGGLVEAPELAACLTLSKNDFIRSGAQGASYLAYLKAIQEVISRQLAVWGDRTDAETRPRMARLERDLERVLEDLEDDFPHDHVAASGALDTVAGRRRPTRYGLRVQFESRPDDTEPARLVDSTIWINDAHPAYTRAASSRSLGYHTAIAVALALAPLAVDTRDEHAFVTQFLSTGAERRPRNERVADGEQPPHNRGHYLPWRISAAPRLMRDPLIS